MIWSLILYLLAGLLLDSIITFHFRCVADGRKLLAAGTTFIYVVLNFVILGQILTSPNMIMPVIAYAIGSTVGTLLAFGKTTAAEQER